jgi:hypothetical protein
MLSLHAGIARFHQTDIFARLFAAHLRILSGQQRLAKTTVLVIRVGGIVPCGREAVLEPFE